MAGSAKLELDLFMGLIFVYFPSLKTTRSQCLQKINVKIIHRVSNSLSEFYAANYEGLNKPKPRAHDQPRSIYFYADNTCTNRSKC